MLRSIGDAIDTLRLNWLLLAELKKSFPGFKFSAILAVLSGLGTEFVFTYAESHNKDESQEEKTDSAEAATNEAVPAGA